MKTTVKDVMTSDVVVVARSARFKDVARLMALYGVSALPVVDDHERLAGIISEADLLLKEEDGEREIPLIETTKRRRERRKAEGVLASELMTTPVVWIGPDAHVRDAARLMHREQVKRLPVVDEEGRVIGIVSRRDLLKVFLRTDEDIEAEVRQDVLKRALWMDPGALGVEVRGGVVSLHGKVERASLIPVLVSIVRGLDGVVDVEHDLTYEFDDTHLRPDLTEPWSVLPVSVRWWP